MGFAGKTIVVTGGASGIGAALVQQFMAAGARVCAMDIAFPDAGPRNADLNITCDVSNENDLSKAIDRVSNELGSIEIFVSNAGVLGSQKDHAASGEDRVWQRCWSVNVMAHVYAARKLLPQMLARGSGYFVTVASAAGLLNQIEDAAYSATKHAAVSFAESLAISHGAQGIGVSLVCPQYVATPMIGLSDADAASAASLLSADEVAACILSAVKTRQFLVLPHDDVRAFAVLRAQDHDRWIGGMQKLRQRAIKEFNAPEPADFYKLL